MSLETRAWLSVAVLGLMMALLLFVPAGTLRYWNAWAYLVVFFGAAIAMTSYLIRKDPKLLERRMSSGPTAERRGAQRVIMVVVSIAFSALLLVPALDHRYGWTHVPTAIVALGFLLVALGFYFVFLVYQTNTYASATIEIAEDRKVIDTGPYAIVRHPMYAGASLYLFGTPLALGSYWGVLAFVVMIPFLIWRLIDEERLLVNELPGYADYRQLVRYRLVPFIW